MRVEGHSGEKYTTGRMLPCRRRLWPCHGHPLHRCRDRIPAKRNRAVIRAAFDAWQAGTGSPFDLLADDARWTIEGNSAASKTYPSREAFLAEVIRPFNARMKVGLKPALREIYADGDTVIVFFDARGIARDDRPYVNTYAWFLVLRDGRIIRGNAFYDAVEFNDLWSRVEPEAAH